MSHEPPVVFPPYGADGADRWPPDFDLRHEPPVTVVHNHAPTPLPLDAMSADADVYIAAPLERRADARQLAAELAIRGVRVVSTWHCTDATREGERTAADWEISRALAANAHEITRADVVVMLHASAGRETLVELGLAIAGCVPVIAIDSVRLASYRRPGVEWIDPEESPDLIGAIVAEILALV
jgi:nucleoside 2-deoxyribosyltransferase